MTTSGWAASGAMWLTGQADGPPLEAPDDVVRAMEQLGVAAGIEVLPLLGERAACSGLRRRGATSCGGATRLLPAGDGELVAVALARPADEALLPARIDVDQPPDAVMDESVWASVAATIAALPAPELIDRAAMLGLAVSRRGEVARTRPVITREIGEALPLARPPFVVDLSSLWAGPLATRLLRDAGARVVKVESIARPDGGRAGDARFFDLLHGGKESVALDLRRPDGIGQLRALLRAADVVVEASRPRALEHLGIDADELLADGPRVWLSITGYGRSGRDGQRVAFGDDAAVAGGLVAEVDGDACFVADAVADPLTGVVAAGAVLEALETGGRVLLDIALALVAAEVASPGSGWRTGSEADAARPKAPEPSDRAPALGEHTDAVLREVLA